MNIYDIIKNLYCNKKIDWINEIEDNEIEPFVIQRFLCMNDGLRVQTRWLDQFVYHLPPKMYLSLAWSIIPKSDRQPFINYIKKQKEQDDEFDFIFKKIRKHFKLSDNDFNANKERIRIAIKKDMIDWFCFYGIEKEYWKKFQLNYKLLKNYGIDKKNVASDLNKWGF
jgi:hypothetical protein